MVEMVTIIGGTLSFWTKKPFNEPKHKARRIGATNTIIGLISEFLLIIQAIKYSADAAIGQIEISIPPEIMTTSMAIDIITI